MSREEKAYQAPYDDLAERSVLGAMIINREAIDEASEILVSQDFYSSNHQEIFLAILSLVQSGKAVDYITLADELKQKGLLESMGGISYIAELASHVSTVVNVKEYAGIVKDKAVLRKLISVSSEINQRAYNGEDSQEIIGFAEEEVYAISQGQIHRGLTPISESVLETVQRIEELSMADSDITGVTTGLRDLDKQLSGLQKNDLILLAARPSMGKTALGVNIGIAAADAGHNVAIFSLEMSKMQLVQRILSHSSDIELQDIIRGNIDNWDNLAMTMEYVSNLGIYMDDTSGISLSELRSKCRRLSSSEGLDLIIIDYLQLMTTDGNQQNRQQEISDISRGLKGLAMDLNCPVIALSQLSRAPELRSDHRPIMSDLRESGAIEQDADVVLMLYRDEYYHEDTESPGITEVIITKHRNGPTGTVELYFDKTKAKFITIQHDY